MPMIAAGDDSGGEGGGGFRVMYRGWGVKRELGHPRYNTKV